MTKQELINISLPILQGLLASGHYTGVDVLKNDKPYVEFNAVKDAVNLALDLEEHCQNEENI